MQIRVRYEAYPHLYITILDINLYSHTIFKKIVTFFVLSLYKLGFVIQDTIGNRVVLMYNFRAKDYIFDLIPYISQCPVELPVST